MTVEDLDLVLKPVVEVLEYQSNLLSGIICFVGVVTGILLIKILWEQF